jgi:hypothetical protein
VIDLDGSCAKASDVAATEALVASEIAHLRTNVRETKIILYLRVSGPALRFTQSSFLKPLSQAEARSAEHDGPIVRPQLKTSL